MIPLASLKRRPPHWDSIALHTLGTKMKKNKKTDMGHPEQPMTLMTKIVISTQKLFSLVKLRCATFFIDKI